jgi:hypothetical protein
MILIVLSSGCISIGGFTDVLSSDDSSNITELNKSDNGTYSVDGVSFKCPDGWHVATTNQGVGNMIIGSPDVGIFPMFAPMFQIQIIPNSEIPDPNDSGYATPDNVNMDDPFSNYGTVIPGDVLIKGNSSDFSSIPTKNNLSEQKIIDIMRKDMDSFGIRVSNDTINIDGKTAYEDVFIFNSILPPVIDRKIVRIIFVKNEKTYLMLFECQNWDYNKEKPNFDIILNSFKVD